VKQQSFRSYVVALLIGMVSCSSSTRAKLWAGNGLDIFLQLLSEDVSAASQPASLLYLPACLPARLPALPAISAAPLPLHIPNHTHAPTPTPTPTHNHTPSHPQDPKLQVSILRALDTWLAEDHNRVELRLTQRDAAQHLTECFRRTVHPRDDTLLPQVSGGPGRAPCPARRSACSRPRLPGAAGPPGCSMQRTSRICGELHAAASTLTPLAATHPRTHRPPTLPGRCWTCCAPAWAARPSWRWGWPRRASRSRCWTRSG
jgi:hypothetical protein